MMVKPSCRDADLSRLSHSADLSRLSHSETSKSIAHNDSPKHQKGFRIFKTSVVAFLIIAALGLVSCDRPKTDDFATEPQSTPTQPGIPTQETTMDDRLVDAYTTFGFKLFSQVYQQQKQQNIFLSPASITNALAIAYNGADGSTQRAIAQTLEFQGMSLAEVNQGNAALNASLQALDKEVELTVANSLWLNQNASFLPDFLQRVSESYNAKISTIDFSQPTAPSTINNWVSEKTNEKIPKIVEQIDAQTIAYLINAIYFKGTWTDPFAKDATRDRSFTLLDGSTKQHPLMFTSGEFRYLETEKFQAVSLPYEDGRFSLYVFLPKADVTTENFYQNLTLDKWTNWMNEFRSQPGSIQLPRFKLEYDIALNDILKDLGMEIAFDRTNADFSNMTLAENVHISQVKHKTFVEVNEEGTEAAAATSVGVSVTSAPVDPPFNMVVDRPFFAVIRDNRSGLILFMGSIVDPQN